MLPLVLVCRLKDLGEHQFRCRLLLIEAVVLLYLPFVIGGEPVDAARLVQFRYGLCEHLLIGYPSAHIHLVRHLHAEVAARAVARG